MNNDRIYSLYSFSINITWNDAVWKQKSDSLVRELDLDQGIKSSIQINFILRSFLNWAHFLCNVIIGKFNIAHYSDHDLIAPIKLFFLDMEADWLVLELFLINFSLGRPICVSLEFLKKFWRIHDSNSFSTNRWHSSRGIQDVMNLDLVHRNVIVRSIRKLLIKVGEQF